MLTNSKTSLLLILLQQHGPVMTGILYGQCLITAGLIMTGLFASQLSKRIVTSPSALHSASFRNKTKREDNKAGVIRNWPGYLSHTLLNSLLQ